MQKTLNKYEKNILNKLYKPESRMFFKKKNNFNKKAIQNKINQIINSTKTNNYN